MTNDEFIAAYMIDYDLVFSVFPDFLSVNPYRIGKLTVSVAELPNRVQLAKTITASRALISRPTYAIN